MRRGDRAVVDLRRQRLAMRVGEQGLGTCCLAVDQSVGSVRVEAQHSIADDLQRDGAQQRRLRTRSTVVDRRQGQQTAGLGRVLAPPCKAAQSASTEIETKGDGTRHGGTSGDHHDESHQRRVGESPT